jgi:hypothetical protein
LPKVRPAGILHPGAKAVLAAGGAALPFLRSVSTISVCTASRYPAGGWPVSGRRD